jgi:hypothetical protein
MERPGPLAAHKASDYITQEIREAVKKAVPTGSIGMIKLSCIAP